MTVAIPTSSFEAEENRLAELHSFDLLDTSPEDAYDDFVQLAATTCSVPIAGISLIDARREWFKATLGFEVGEISREFSVCPTTISQPRLVIISDTHREARFSGHPLVTGAPHLRFYAAVPLITRTGCVLGALFVGDTVSRTLPAPQEETLTILARRIVDRMELSRKISAQSSHFEPLELIPPAKSESEVRFQAAFENAAVGASIADRKGRFVAVNRAYCALTGYSEAELLTSAFTNLTHPDDLPNNLAVMEKLWKGEIPSFVLEKRYIRKDATTFWIKISVSLGRDAQGRPEHTLALTEDITDKREALEAQAEVQKRTNQMVAVGEALGGALTTVEVTKVILQAAIPIFEAQMGLVVLLSEDNTTLRIAQVVGVPAALSEPWREFTPDAPAPLAEAVRERRMVVVPNDERYGIQSQSAPAPIDRPDVQLAVPLLIADRCIGGLGLICPADKCRDDGQQTFLWTLAGQCALALERARLYDEARREVEERRRAEEALRDSEAQFRHIIDSSPVAFALNDDQQNITFLNAEFRKTFGYTLNDISTLSDWWPLAYPDPAYRQWVATTWQAHLEKAKRTKSSFEAMELTVRCKDGTERTVLAAAMLLGDSFARTHVVSLYDITERKRAELKQKSVEEALRETLILQQAILDSANYSIISMAEDGTITTFNAGAEQMLGYKANDVVGQTTIAHFHDTAELAARAGVRLPRTAGRFDAGHEILVASARRGETAETEWTQVRKNGTIFPVTLSVMPLRDASGTITGFLAIGRDISERRKAEAARRVAEENYRALFMNAVGGIFQTSPQGHYLRVNPALARIYGYESPKQMVDELTDVASQLYVQPGRRAEFERTIRQQGFVSRFESEVRRRDGSVIWISENARPIWDESGVLLRYEGFVEDISDHKALEAQQAGALQEAIERADRDPLTGLLNHRAFHGKLDAEAARAKREQTNLAVVMLDLDNFKFFNDVYGHATGDEVLRAVAARLRTACRGYDTLARFGGDEFALLLPGVGESTAEEIEARLRSALDGLCYRFDEHETAIPVSISVGTALFPVAGADYHAVLRHADERLRWSKTGGDVENARRVRAYAGTRVQGFSMLDALVTAVDNKDRYTRRHSEDVIEYCLLIARELGYDEAAQRTVALSALLHDVGKIGVPDSVLRKPGKLTAEEFDAIRQHPMMGAAIVSTVPGLEGTLDAVRHHHERWDGTGYPDGLRAEECPQSARLMAVADAFSAMTTDRPYRRGMDREQALEILDEGAGSQWDPECVQAFIRALSRVR
jgi:diguanylate cyclase (GGDEF)-like protein/PAS domain S-box-containing protein